MAILLLAAVLCTPSHGWAAWADSGIVSEQVFYLIVDTTVLRAEPHARARSVRKLKRYDVLAGREMVAGWLRVDGASVGHEDGWIPIERENVLKGPLETLKRRLFRVQEAKWPDRVKLDVARGRIRPGFTADQVPLALGDPRLKELQRTGTSVAEAWTYEDQRVVFSHTGVRAIEPLTPERSK